MNITIKVIPNSDHRHGITGADWYWDENMDLQVRVSKMSDWRFEVCLIMHEVAEALLCMHNLVSQEKVDDFDRAYETDHPNNKIEAGDDPKSPYRREHCFATAIERIMAAEMEIDWPKYDAELEAL